MTITAPNPDTDKNLDATLASVNAQISRTDSKASLLLAFDGAALVGIASLADKPLPLATKVIGGLAALVLAVAADLLLRGGGGGGGSSSHRWKRPQPRARQLSPSRAALARRNPPGDGPGPPPRQPQGPVGSGRRQVHGPRQGRRPHPRRPGPSRARGRRSAGLPGPRLPVARPATPGPDVRPKDVGPPRSSAPDRQPPTGRPERLLRHSRLNPQGERTP